MVHFIKHNITHSHRKSDLDRSLINYGLNVKKAEEEELEFGNDKKCVKKVCLPK